MKVKKLLNSLAVPQSLFTARLMYWLVIIVYPVTALLLTKFNTNLNDPILDRMIFVGIVFAAFIASFTSPFVRREISIISLLLYYLLTFHGHYLLFENNFQAAYLVGLVIIIMGGAIILEDLKSWFVYLTLTSPFIILVLLDSGEGFKTNQYITVTLIFVANVVTAAIILVRIELSSKMKLWHHVIQKIKADILVFNEENDLILTNRIPANSAMEKQLLSGFDTDFVDKVRNLNPSESIEIAQERDFESKQWMKWEATEYEDLKICIGLDVSDMKDREDELRQFAYITSHDLKAPVRRANMLAQILNTDYGNILDDDGKKNLQRLQDSLQSMNHLINGILEITQIGFIKTNLTHVDLKKLLGNVIESLLIPDDVEILITQDLPVLRTDAVRIRQIFQNLIDNAVKFKDKEKGVVTIGWAKVEDRIIFQISDNGPGIAPKHMERIFQLFQTLQPDRIDNTGIGLSIVKKSVESLGGSIRVESEVGEGTIFHFALPAKDFYDIQKTSPINHKEEQLNT